MIREHTKGQSVRETQIVYNTKSDLIVFVIAAKVHKNEVKPNFNPISWILSRNI